MQALHKRDASAEGQAAALDIWRDADILRELAYARAVGQLRTRRLLHQRWVIVLGFVLCFGLGVTVGASSAGVLPTGHSWPSFFSSMLSAVPGMSESHAPVLAPAAAPHPAASAALQSSMDAAPEASTPTVKDLSATGEEKTLAVTGQDPIQTAPSLSYQRTQGAPARITESFADKADGAAPVAKTDKERSAKPKASSSEKTPKVSQNKAENNGRTVRDQPSTEALTSPLVIIEQ